MEKINITKKREKTNSLSVNKIKEKDQEVKEVKGQEMKNTKVKNPKAKEKVKNIKNVGKEKNNKILH